MNSENTHTLNRLNNNKEGDYENMGKKRMYRLISQVIR